MDGGRSMRAEDYVASLKGEGRRAVDTPTRKDSRPLYLGVILGVKAGRLR